MKKLWFGVVFWGGLGAIVGAGFGSFMDTVGPILGGVFGMTFGLIIASFILANTLPGNSSNHDHTDM